MNASHISPAMRFLRGLFFRSIGQAEDRERRLQETGRRVEHANRMLGNSFERLNESSARLRDLGEEMTAPDYVEAMRQLSKTLDKG